MIRTKAQQQNLSTSKTLNRTREHTHTQNAVDGTDLGTGLAANVLSMMNMSDFAAYLECALPQGESAKRPVRPPRPALLRSLEVQTAVFWSLHRGMSPGESKTRWFFFPKIGVPPNHAF